MVRHNGHPDHLKIGSPYQYEDDLYAFGSLILTIKDKMGKLVLPEIENLGKQIKNNEIDLANFLINLKEIKTSDIKCNVFASLKYESTF